MQCKQCNEALEPSQGKKPRVFCSDKCRKAYKRTQDKKRTEQTDKVETDTNKRTGITGSVESRSQATGEAGEPKKAEKLKLSAIEAEEYMSDNADWMDAPMGLPKCTCRHCQNVKASGSRHTLNHGYGPHRDANTLAKDELIRVALPGDADYQGVV